MNLEALFEDCSCERKDKNQILYLNSVRLTIEFKNLQKNYVAAVFWHDRLQGTCLGKASKNFELEILNYSFYDIELCFVLGIMQEKIVVTHWKGYLALEDIFFSSSKLCYVKMMPVSKSISSENNPFLLAGNFTVVPYRVVDRFIQHTSTDAILCIKQLRTEKDLSCENIFIEVYQSEDLKSFQLDQCEGQLQPIFTLNAVFANEEKIFAFDFYERIVDYKCETLVFMIKSYAQKESKFAGAAFTQLSKRKPFVSVDLKLQVYEDWQQMECKASDELNNACKVYKNSVENKNEELELKQNVLFISFLELPETENYEEFLLLFSKHPSMPFFKWLLARAAVEAEKISCNFALDLVLDWLKKSMDASLSYESIQQLFGREFFFNFFSFCILNWFKEKSQKVLLKIQNDFSVNHLACLFLDFGANKADIFEGLFCFTELNCYLAAFYFSISHFSSVHEDKLLLFPARLEIFFEFNQKSLESLCKKNCLNILRSQGTKTDMIESYLVSDPLFFPARQSMEREKAIYILSYQKYNEFAAFQLLYQAKSAEEAITCGNILLSKNDLTNEQRNQVHLCMAKLYQVQANAEYTKQFSYYMISFYGHGIPCALRQKSFVIEFSEDKPLAEVTQLFRDDFKHCQIGDENQAFQSISIKKIESAQPTLFTGFSNDSNLISCKEFYYAANSTDQILIVTKEGFPNCRKMAQIAYFSENKTSSISHAIQTISEKNKKLNNLLTVTDTSCNAKQLQLLVLGSLQSGCNGGLVIYKNAFLNGEYEQDHPQDYYLIKKLTILIREHEALLRKASEKVSITFY